MRHAFIRLALAGLAMLGLLAAGAGAQAQEKVSFPSRDGTTLDGYLFRAKAANGPGPAVVFAHGCGGLIGKTGINARETDWAQRLTGAGYNVLMVDSFTPRGVKTMCAPATFRSEVYRARPQDMYGALAYLQAQAFVDPGRIALMGWSQGGGAVLNTLRVNSAARPAGLAPARDFQAAVAFYPGSCSADRQRGGWSTRIPLLVLTGEKDVWTPLQPCEALLTEAASAGSPVTLRIYSGAYHDFDWPGLAYRERPEFRTKEGVVPIVATDPAARADALARVPTFLSRHLEPGAQ
ncbi:dienelactone hydrolase family protein [Aquabacter sp. L1I39]|uniref:dienelactone hydrolase family protein n=1 Tax=Aquabacter sp. L1I39 TaxID=2820278 RepID=UPI001ADB5382|nr:dienelactone hydrolase family protein [Aquabacter sp. L1I39]QTL03394.1 dienelactone hydrolase family protein [Aquabacter sp. L1I39]